MAVGRPISLTPNIATESLSSTATASQTSFTVTGGYRINELGVYRNGVRLVQGKDFTASDGSTVTLLSGATVDDIIDFQIFDSFNIADALNSVGNQSIEGSLTATEFFGDGSTLSGVGTANINTNNIQVSGITTLGTETTVVGSAVTFTASGGTIVGVLTATSFSGDISNTTGIQTAYIDAASITSSGIVSVTNTTASTSTSTGALIVSGGVGIAGSMFVGENVSIGGTLTYEDVTNIDSVGIITAQTGVRVTAGGLVVTAGVTTFSGADINIDGSAVGVTSVTWDASADSLIWKDNSKATFGDSSDLSLYHDGTHSHIVSDTGNLRILAGGSGNLVLTAKNGEEAINCATDGEVVLSFDGVSKFATTPTGVNVTGVATASDYYIGVGGTSVHTALGTKASTGKAIAMAMVFG